MFKRIKSYQLGLLIVLSLAFVIRVFPQILLPYFYIDDESRTMVLPILTMLGMHSLDPHFYKYGSLIYYFNIPIYAVYFHMMKAFSSSPFFFDILTPSLYYIGRYESAIFDILTILLTYKIGERLFDRRIAFLSSIFMTLNPLELFMSHLFKPDTFMTFFAMCVFYFSIRLKEKEQLKWYILAGVFSGFAMSTKLDFFVIIMPATGWFMYYYKTATLDSTHKHKIMNLVVFLLVSCISFFLTSPYLVLHIPEFLHAIFHEFSHNQQVNFVNDIFHTKFIAQFAVIFPFILSISVYLLSIFGIYLYTKKKGFYQALFYLIYPFLYFLVVTVISNRPSYILYSYFYLTILPFFILLAAYSFIYIWDKLNNKTIKNLITMVVFVDLLLASGSFINVFYTYNKVGNWVNKNINRGSKILMLNTFRPVFKWKYFVYPLYTETPKTASIEDFINVIQPDFIIATNYDLHLIGGYKKFNNLMKADNFGKVETFIPEYAPYVYLCSTFIPDISLGKIYIYKNLVFD